MNKKYFFYGLGVAAVIGAIVYYLFLKPSEAATTTEEDKAPPIVDLGCPKGFFKNDPDFSSYGGFCVYVLQNIKGGLPSNTKYSKSLSAGMFQVFETFEYVVMDDGLVMAKFPKTRFEMFHFADFVNQKGANYLYDNELKGVKLFRSKEAKAIYEKDKNRVIFVTKNGMSAQELSDFAKNWYVDDFIALWEKWLEIAPKRLVASNSLPTSSGGVFVPSGSCNGGTCNSPNIPQSDRYRIP